MAIREKYEALVFGFFGECSKDFITRRDYIARQKAYAHVKHFYSSVIEAMSMFKLRITSRWALMAARGWVRPILDRGRDLISDCPNRAAIMDSPQYMGATVARARPERAVRSSMDCRPCHESQQLRGDFDCLVSNPTDDGRAHVDRIAPHMAYGLQLGLYVARCYIPVTAT